MIKHNYKLVKCHSFLLQKYIASPVIASAEIYGNLFRWKPLEFIRASVDTEDGAHIFNVFVFSEMRMIEADRINLVRQNNNSVKLKVKTIVGDCSIIQVVIFLCHYYIFSF